MVKGMVKGGVEETSSGLGVDLVALRYGRAPALRHEHLHPRPSPEVPARARSEEGGGRRRDGGPVKSEEGGGRRQEGG